MASLGQYPQDDRWSPHVHVHTLAQRKSQKERGKVALNLDLFVVLYFYSITCFVSIHFWRENSHLWRNSQLFVLNDYVSDAVIYLPRWFLILEWHRNQLQSQTPSLKNQDWVFSPPKRPCTASIIPSAVSFQPKLFFWFGPWLCCSSWLTLVMGLPCARKGRRIWPDANSEAVKP